MFEVILAVDPKGGIGYQGKLPWSCKDELKIFKEKTLNNILVVGTNTLISLPVLKDREICMLTRDPFNVEHANYIIKHGAKIVSTLECPQLLWSDKKVFIAGGSEVYRHALTHPHLIHKIHISLMKKTYDCDTFFDFTLLKNFVIEEEEDHEEFKHLVLVKSATPGEQQYLDLLNNIKNNGITRQGRNGFTRSLFVEHFTFNLQNGFPLLTTKKMHMRGIIEEFLFFLRGDTDTNLLSDKNVNIWKGNTTSEFIQNKGLQYAEGIMGPMYGYQWRNFNAPYMLDDDKKPLPNIKGWGIDQLANVVDLIKKDPSSRRILMTSFNPNQAEDGVLYPCHSITIQFYVEDDYLDMFCYNRSQDTFLGVPYNIASSSLLLMVISKLTNKLPRFLKITMGDVHLYQEHLDLVDIQNERIPHKFPTMQINKDLITITDLNTLVYEDFELINYKYYPIIRANMIA